MPLDAKKWQKTCTSCWVEKRQQTHSPCPTCPPAKATHLRKKKEEACCKDCLAELAAQISADDFKAPKKDEVSMEKRLKLTIPDHPVEAVGITCVAPAPVPPPVPPPDAPVDYERMSTDALREMLKGEMLKASIAKRLHS